MGTRLQVAWIISSIAFIVLVGAGFIVILSIPELARQPIYPMLGTVVVGFVVTPIIGWFIASRMMKPR